MKDFYLNDKVPPTCTVSKVEDFPFSAIAIEILMIERLL